MNTLSLLKTADVPQEEFEDTKGIIRIRNSKKNRQHNGKTKNDKQRYTKHYTENKRSSNANPTKTITYIVWWYNTLYQVEPVVWTSITTSCDAVSLRNRQDLIQSLVQTQYGCNVAPFFYHHSVVIQHLVSDTLYQTGYFL